MKLIKLFFLLIPFGGSAQHDTVTVDEAIALALKNNLGLHAASQNILYHQQLKKTASEIPRTEIGFMYGQYNSIVRDNNISFLQSIPFPTVFSSKSTLAQSQVKASEAKKSMTEKELVLQIKEIYYQLLYLNERRQQLEQQDSLFRGLAQAITKKLQAGEATQLEMTKTIAQHNEIRNLINQNSADQIIYESHLQALLHHPHPLSIAHFKLEPLPFPDELDSVDIEVSPNLQFMKQQVSISESMKRIEKARILPEFKVGFFSQTLVGTQKINGQDQFFGLGKRFTGLQVGLSLPIWFIPQTAQIKAGGMAKKGAEFEYEQSKINWWAQTREAYQQAFKHKTSLDYYTSSGLPMARLIQQQALLSFRQGEISFMEFLLNMNQALSIKEAHLQTLLRYNQSIIRIEFFTTQKQQQ